ncbi:MAG TPA: PEP-CTERM sorting domain-containing protein, partial [Gemmataceae bacterium]|nr:PEP-CTERM sorting domain-containing protein [Gemmataceae bacterium]
TVDPPQFMGDPPGFAFAEVRYSPNPLVVSNGEVVGQIVPEPGTLALVLVGGAILACHRRLRKGLRRAGSPAV